MTEEVAIEKKETLVHKQGKPWANAGVFSSYEEASSAMMHMIAEQPTFNYKIRRSGDGGSLFTIKKRINPELDAANKKMEAKLSKLSEDKKTKKSKKSSKTA